MVKDNRTREHEAARSRAYYHAHREERLAYSRAYQRANPEKKKAIDKRSHDKNKAHHNTKSREWYANNKVHMQDLALQKKYGITLEDYNKMFAEQNGCCAMCGRHQSEFKRALAVDHNHITGAVRGLLCMRCNTTLGSYELLRLNIERYLSDRQ